MQKGGDLGGALGSLAGTWTDDGGRGRTAAEVERAGMEACLRTEAQEASGTRQVSPVDISPEVLAEAYERCGKVTSEYAKTFYLGTTLMTEEQALSVRAIYVWCRRTDELVDGPHATHITPEALERWDERLQDIFEGRPYDVLDAALADTVARFPVSIEPFRDMVDGMRMDLLKWRYKNFDELYEYCYRVAGTVALMSVPVMGIDEKYEGDPADVYSAALALGVANQLTNILRDVGEDTLRNRIYVPQDDLAEFGISEEEVMNATLKNADGTMDERWVRFMKFQIARAREYFVKAEEGVYGLGPLARWPVMTSLVVYRGILDAIEENGYDNFTQRAYVPKNTKLALLPAALLKCHVPLFRNIV